MSACSRCGTTFSCAMVDGDTTEPCWCTRLPAVPAGALTASAGASGTDRCLCPACLRSEIESLGHKAN